LTRNTALPTHRLAGLVDGVQGENGFGRIDAYALNLGHGRLRSWLLTTQFWHAMPWGRPPQHSTDQGQDGPEPNLLCDDRLATDGIRASGRQHPVQNRHANGSLSLLGRKAASA
jgi:hypothetical protein